VFLQIDFGVVAALAQARFAIAEPRAALLDNTQLHGQIQQFAGFGDALAEHDIEIRLAERRSHLVFNHLRPRAAADHSTGGILKLLGTAHVDTHRGIIFQRVAAGSHLWIAVHDAHLQTQLVDEDDDGARLADDARQLAHGLAHQAGLQAHMGVAHFALDLGTGHHGRHGVHDHTVDGARAHQRLADLQRLLARVRLADEKAVDINTQRLGVYRVQRVFHVDERNLTAALLGLGNAVQRQRRFARRFRPVDLDDTPAGQAADAQRHVQRDASRGNGVHLHGDILPQLHHGAFPELFFNLCQRRFQRAFFITRSLFVRRRLFFLRHNVPPSCGAAQPAPLFKYNAQTVL
jgi:hypothetical protein